MSESVHDVVVCCGHGPCAPVRPVARLLGGSGQRQVRAASVPRVTCALLAARRLETAVPNAVVMALAHAPSGKTAPTVPVEFVGVRADMPLGTPAAQAKQWATAVAAA